MTVAELIDALEEFDGHETVRVMIPADLETGTFDVGGAVPAVDEPAIYIAR